MAIKDVRLKTLTSSKRQRGECTDDYLFATGEIKGYKTACEKVDTML